MAQNNQKSAFGTSSVPDITIFIYKFEVPKVADSHLLVCVVFPDVLTEIAAFIFDR